MAGFIDKFQRYCGSKTLSALIIANIAVFLASWAAVLAGNAMGETGNFTMQWLCVPASPSLFLHRIWTAATYMVTHYDFLHLLFNMLWLFWFGRMLLTTLSERHLLWLYVGGGLFGALLYILSIATWPEGSATATYLCGASASVLSIMAAAAIRTPDLRVGLFLIGEVKLQWVAIGCIILTFVGVGGGNSGGQAAHIGGVIFGASFALATKMGFDPAKKLNISNAEITRKPRNAKPRMNVSRDGNAVAKAAAGRLADSDRLDQLLDKIRMSGYPSLTASERNELNALSQRLMKDNH